MRNRGELFGQQKVRHRQITKMNFFLASPFGKSGFAEGKDGEGNSEFRTPNLNEVSL